MSPAPRMSGSPTAVSVASHSSPGVQLQPAAGQPLRVRVRAHPDDDEVGGDARPVGQLDRLDPAVRHGARRRPFARRRSTPWSRCRLGAPLAQLRAQRQHRRRRDVDQGHVEALLARGLGDLAADEARAHDDDARAALERRPQREPVIEAAQDVDALQFAAGAGPASRPGARSPGSAGRTEARRRRRARPAGARDPASSPARPGATARRSVSDGSRTRSASCSPASSSFDSGGRVYGRWASSPTTTSSPSNPPVRAACAARSPASDAPTMTTRRTLFSSARDR